MDDRNRRDRMRRDTEQNRRNPDYLGSRQAEQFDDSASYAQDDGWSDSEQYGRQRGERARPVGLYYEEYVVRAPRRDRQRDDEAARRRKMDHRGHGPSDYTRSDDRIREDINDNLTDDWAVDARKVSVKVENGEVTLSGTVPTRLQKRRAEDCAEEASGVKHVQNNLRVEESSSPGASG
jgi:osmotically-inducible protein OsmY